MLEKPDPAIREILVVDDPDAMKLLLSGKYNEVMDLIDSREMSVSEIAKTLKVNPGSVHYHLKELEKFGLVKIVREETKGNIVKKFYRTAARTIYLDSSRFKAFGGEDPSRAFREKLIELLVPFGYDLPPELAAAFNETMVRYDKRRKELLREIQDVHIDAADNIFSGDAFYLALLLKEIEDQEMGLVREELRALLSKLRDGQ